MSHGSPSLAITLLAANMIAGTEGALLVELRGSSNRLSSRCLRTLRGAVDVAAVAMRANHCELAAACAAKESKGVRNRAALCHVTVDRKGDSRDTHRVNESPLTLSGVPLSAKTEGLHFFFGVTFYRRWELELNPSMLLSEEVARLPERRGQRRGRRGRRGTRSQSRGRGIGEGLLGLAVRMRRFLNGGDTLARRHCPNPPRRRFPSPQPP